MAKRRHYSDEERAACLAALAANGGNVGRTARQLNISRGTLQQWAKRRGTSEEVAQLAHQKKGDLAAALDAIAWKAVEVLPGKLADASAAQVATVLGIAVDKARLLRGQPTAISDSTHRLDDMTDDEVEREIARLQAAPPGLVRPAEPPSRTP